MRNVDLTGIPYRESGWRLKPSDAEVRLRFCRACGEPYSFGLARGVPDSIVCPACGAANDYRPDAKRSADAEGINRLCATISAAGIPVREAAGRLYAAFHPPPPDSHSAQRAARDVGSGGFITAKRGVQVTPMEPTHAQAHAEEDGPQEG